MCAAGKTWIRHEQGYTRRSHGVRRECPEAQVIPESYRLANQCPSSIFQWLEHPELQRYNLNDVSTPHKLLERVFTDDRDRVFCRAMQRGTAAQREAEHLYRTGQHPSSVQMLHHLRRIDSF